MISAPWLGKLTCVYRASSGPLGRPLEHDLHGMTTDEAHDSLADFLLRGAGGRRLCRCAPDPRG